MLAELQHQKEGMKVLRRFIDGTLVSPLLLIGPSGVGKRFSVRKAAQEVFCLGTKTADCKCASCLAIEGGRHPDFKVLSSEGKDIGVSTIRDFLEAVHNLPALGSLKCFVIDGADRLTVAAADSFLKTLEEPPDHIRFFLIAEERERVPPTIQSRCGHVHYRPLPDAFVVSVLQRYEKDTSKALVYSRMGEGSVGSAVQLWASGKIALRDQVLRALSLASKKDWPGLFSVVSAGEEDLILVLKILEQVSHDVLIVRVDPMRVIHTDCLEALQELCQEVPVGVWVKLSRKVRALQAQNRTTHINLTFHVKTHLIESFI